MKKKKLFPPFLIIIFSTLAYTRIEGASNVRPIVFISILVIGVGIGILIKSIIEILK